MPAPAAAACDGVSFVPAAAGQAASSARPIFWHYPHYGNQGGTPGSSVRDGDCKLIEFFEDGHVELYNLSEDIGEEHDLSAREPARVRSLSAALTRWQDDVEALMPARNEAYAPWPDREPCGRHPR